jgi:hypothetical protein
MPGDAKEVARVQIPQADLAEFGAHFGRNARGVFHLGESGDEDVALARSPYGTLQTFRIEGEINSGHCCFLGGWI